MEELAYCRDDRERGLEDALFDLHRRGLVDVTATLISQNGARSGVWRLENTQGKRWFLKTTRSTYYELKTTLRLHEVMPEFTPTVLGNEYAPGGVGLHVPSAFYCEWFALEDAGNVEEEISLQQACQAARSMGVLQREVVRAKQENFARIFLRGYGDHLVPHCYLKLRQIAYQNARWAANQNPPDDAKRLRVLADELLTAKDFWHPIALALMQLPRTLVHCDFWAGNIAFDGENVRFLDWDEVVWGAGGISIANLLTRHQFPEETHDAVWTAFAEGWQRAIPLNYRRASHIARLVASLTLTGFVQTMLQDLEQLVDESRSK